MKLVRYGNPGEEKPGVVDADGIIRDLSEYIIDFNPLHFSNTTLINTIKSLNISHLPCVNQPVRIGPCVGMPGKILCIGYNSSLHTQQMGAKAISSSEMVVFLKPTSSICGPFDPILFTPFTRKLDWEAELGLVIGKKGKYIKKNEAHKYILGYTCVNDLSDRYWQFETEDKQFTKGKGFDNAAPIGPYLVTCEDVADSSDLNIQLYVNGELRQDFNTSDYIHNDIDVIVYLSQYFTLFPGDIISMGSAPGNAKCWGNQFLKPGDKVVFSINGLGQQEHEVIVEPQP